MYSTPLRVSTFLSSNGLVERLHRTLKHRLDKLLFDGLEFISALQQTLFTMRTTVHEALGRTPFAAFFGRECRTKFSALHAKCFFKQHSAQLQQSLY